MGTHTPHIQPVSCCAKGGGRDGWGGRERKRRGDRERGRAARTGPTRRRWSGGSGARRWRDGDAERAPSCPPPPGWTGRRPPGRRAATAHPSAAERTTRLARRRRTGSRAPGGRTRAQVEPRTFTGIPHNTTSTEESPLRTLCGMRRAGSLYEEVFSARCLSTRACSIAELVDLAIGPKIGWTNFEQKPNTSEFCQARRRRSHLLLPRAWVC